MGIGCFLSLNLHFQHIYPNPKEHGAGAAGAAGAGAAAGAAAAGAIAGVSAATAIAAGLAAVAVAAVAGAELSDDDAPAGDDGEEGGSTGGDTGKLLSWICINTNVTS